MNYAELERNLNDFFELLKVDTISESNVLKRYYYETSEKCYLMKSLADTFLERKQVKKWMLFTHFGQSQVYTKIYHLI